MFHPRGYGTGVGMLWQLVNVHRDRTETCSISESLAQPLDYIVVGGGTAGLVVASRLTANPNVTVGVLEDPNVLKLTGMGAMLHNPAYDWMIPKCAAATLPTDTCCLPWDVPISKVLTNALARKILLDDEQRAIGVELQSGETIHQAFSADRVFQFGAMRDQVKTRVEPTSEIELLDRDQARGNI
ncbi:hypothetical protein BO70DRAFT_400870 [Aspergillus heteromorphus CBS 117.55]|uniref:Uncharacterized protein n=1 Tax=Aspergillus heteromorphus CBS 117.55 TaxID=1448321 RepID=A0A317UZU2_9EURO|nr:uncharacterized protein BO70DRAFT_400870 [Aspergillus heteromorphus CBS 117.55]PWY66077.1 hypothetical protein BO70DRAFT_400870 [Aspergillus heteromorphus CBS 117.55]